LISKKKKAFLNVGKLKKVKTKTKQKKKSKIKLVLKTFKREHIDNREGTKNHMNIKLGYHQYQRKN